MLVKQVLGPSFSVPSAKYSGSKQRLVNVPTVARAPRSASIPSLLLLMPYCWNLLHSKVYVGKTCTKEEAEQCNFVNFLMCSPVA